MSAWDVSSVADMSWMFSYANSFNQNLCPWREILHRDMSKEGTFGGTAMPYDSERRFLSLV